MAQRGPAPKGGFSIALADYRIDYTDALLSNLPLAPQRALPIVPYKLDAWSSPA
jgi:hypothetical protein